MISVNVVIPYFNATRFVSDKIESGHRGTHPVHEMVSCLLQALASGVVTPPRAVNSLAGELLALGWLSPDLPYRGTLHARW
jgi:hypothetical protein